MNIKSESRVEKKITISENDMVNAKSLLGLFSFVGKDVLMVAEDNANPDRFLRVVRKMVA